MIAEYAGRRGWGVVGGTGTVAWGQAAVLVCSWLKAVHTAPRGAVLADQDPEGEQGSFRDQNVMGTKGDKDGQCQPTNVWGGTQVCLCRTVCSACGFASVYTCV